MITEVVIIRQYGKCIINVQFTVIRQRNVVELGRIQFKAVILRIRRNQFGLTQYKWEHSINSWIVISRFVGEAQAFDYVDYGSSDYYELPVRVIRFELSPGNYESLVTNLSTQDFSLDALKALYYRRWGIETSFRSLKYTIGLTRFHASKADFVLQEIWARLTAYNFTEAITHCVVIEEKPKNKYGYKVNFSAAVHVCRQFLRSALARHPIDVISLLSRELIPIRDERSFPRLKTAHFRRPAYFLYRPS